MKRVFVCMVWALSLLVLLGLAPGADCLGRDDSTEKTLRRLVHTYPDSALLHAKMASVCFAKGTVRGRVTAIEQMKLALKHDRLNSDYRLILAEMYFESTYWNYGVNELKHALETDPDNGFIHLRLGEAYLERSVDEWQREWFIRTRDQLRLVDSSHMAYQNACRRLAHCYFDLGRPDSSVALLQKIQGDSLNVDDLVLLGMAFSESNDLEASSEAFSRALAAMDDERRNRYMSIELIAVQGELKEAGHTRFRGIKTAGDILWKKRDPNPATEINERLVEHLARVGFADLHFSIPRLGKVGSETTRGEVYIRYGRPLAWHYDPFGDDIFSSETTLPRPAHTGGGTAGIGGWDNYDAPDPGAGHRARPLAAPKRRWKWQYRDFSLNFEDTFYNGDFSFPYEKDWSAYVYAYLEKNVPDIYESQIKKRMRVVIDALNLMDSMGSSCLKIVFGCDTRGIKYEPRYQWPAGEFDIEIAVLDSLYYDIARQKVSVELRADSSALYQTQYPLIGSFSVQVPPGGSVAAVSMESKATGAAGFTSSAVTVRGFGDTLEVSDIEIRFAPDGPPNPSHVYLGRGKAYLAFSIYNLITDARGTGDAEVSYRIVEKPRIRPVLKRLFDAITGQPEAAQSGDLISFESKHKLRSTGPRTQEVIGIDLSPLSGGDYEVEISVTDIGSGQTARAKTDFRIVSELGP